MAQAKLEAEFPDDDMYAGDGAAAGELGAIDLEERPSGDFIDGFLAGVAAVNASFDPNPSARYYYSFDWIGDGEEERAHALATAFRAEPGALSCEITAVADWRAETRRVGGFWLGRALPPGSAETLAAELIEVLEAFFGQDPLEAFRVEIQAADAPEGDHMLFETPDGRLLLDFSVDA